MDGYPFLTASAGRRLAEAGARLVGIDSPNVDDNRDGERPVHTALLSAGIPIVEHLTGLDALASSGFRFFAVPPPMRGLTSFPVRAFAIPGGRRPLMIRATTLLALSVVALPAAAQDAGILDERIRELVEEHPRRDPRVPALRASEPGARKPRARDREAGGRPPPRARDGGAHRDRAYGRGRDPRRREARADHRGARRHGRAAGHGGHRPAVQVDGADDI